MSVRERRLCDVPTASRERQLCDNPSVGMCALCDRDACADHALHPHGGVALKLESTVYVDGSPPRDAPWGYSAQNPNGWAAPKYEIFVCRECRAALGDPARTNDGQATVQVLLADVATVFVKKARAKLAELKMTAKK
jgi:hypothetical protein